MKMIEKILAIAISGVGHKFCIIYVLSLFLLLISSFWFLTKHIKYVRLMQAQICKGSMEVRVFLSITVYSLSVAET